MLTCNKKLEGCKKKFRGKNLVPLNFSDYTSVPDPEIVIDHSHESHYHTRLPRFGTTRSLSGPEEKFLCAYDPTETRRRRTRSWGPQDSVCCQILQDQTKCLKGPSERGLVKCVLVPTWTYILTYPYLVNGSKGRPRAHTPGSCLIF